MLTHLIILLDNKSVSYCHYDNSAYSSRLISLEDLKAGIIWAMKENLNIQFVYPNYELPEDYNKTIETIDHIKIKPASQADGADIISCDNGQYDKIPILEDTIYIIKTNRKEINNNKTKIIKLISHVNRLNFVLSDIEDFIDNDIEEYRKTLIELANHLLTLFKRGKSVQLNLITDRIVLNEMNNCNAGVCNITLAPNGKFYLCPAFYYDNPNNDIGNLKDGLSIKNQQLLRIDHAPICRNCDAYQCKRCIWLNYRLTMEINTPSHQQCVIAHLERNASKYLNQKMNDMGIKINNAQEIKEIDYLDPINFVNKWK